MAFSLKEDWPAVAAGGAVVVGLVLASRRTVTSENVPVSVGPDAASYAAAVQGATQIQLAREQTRGQVASAFLGVQAVREQTAAAERIALAQTQAAVQVASEQAAAARAQSEAQLAAVRGQQNVQQQGDLFSFILRAIPLIGPLFSVERTADAKSRFARGVYRWNVLLRSDLTGLQTLYAGNVPGVDYPEQAAA